MEVRGRNHSLSQLSTESQTQLHQQVIDHMSQLQRQFEQTTKMSKEVESQQKNAEVLQKKILEQAQEEKAKREELLKKAHQMAQADLIAKQELRKAQEQDAINKEQHVLNFQKQLDEEAKALADKKQQLEARRKEVESAKLKAAEAQKAEMEIKARLQKEEQVRSEMEKKEQQRTQEALKKNQELQAQHEQQMKKLIKQQLDLQQKKKAILDEQERERDRLEKQLQVVNHMKQELLKASGDPQQALNQEQKQEVADNLNLLSKEQLVIQEAIEKVKAAEQAGEKKGLENAQKLLQKAQTQSLEQSEADVVHLKQKFQSTSQQVQTIIQNFQQVHNDLKALQGEYIQTLAQQEKAPSVAANVQISDQSADKSTLAL